jgi:hypothetical protein
MPISPISINPFDPKIIENPAPFFALLRQQAPLYQLPNKAYYLLSRYQDIQQVVMDTETFSSNLVAVLMADEGESPAVMTLAGGGDKAATATDVLAIADPPIHTRQRRVANRAFTRRRVEQMQGNIQALADSLIDNFSCADIDWVGEFANPLPMTIIVELLGLPRQDMVQLKQWSDASVALLSGINSADELVAHGMKINQLIGYLATRYDEAYDRPADNLLGDLVREAKVDAEQFGRDEVVSMLVQLLTAGNETTASLIGSAMMVMLQTPGLQGTLRANPAKIGNFVEEVLRLEAPFHGHFRVATRDTQLAGTRLKRGDRLMLLWSSAGRDEQQFSHADSVDLNRDKPKSHLSFGYGIHHCIGAALARAEARIALETILARSDDIQLSADNDFAHIPSLFIRSLKKLSIRLTSFAAACS